MQILEKFERKLPLVRLGADVIVGFPTESDDDFKKTYQLIKDTPLTHLHIFPFSIRPYTRFSADDDNIPPEVKARRARVLRNLINRKNELFLRKNLGTTASVFFEGDGNRGGLTGNYIRVQVPNSKISCFAQIKLLGIKGKVVTGEMVH
jgi:threonylcarbamoyladenosine tRNA methylthiotransferase MtaB